MIKVYSTTTCPYCKMETDWLDSQGVAYKEVKVDQDQKAAEEMVRKTGQMGVPVTEIELKNGDKEYIIGFNKPHLQYFIAGMK